MDETLEAGEIIPVRIPSSYDVLTTFTVRSCIALFEEDPVRGNVLLRTMLLILLRLKLELRPGDFVELEAAGGDAGELDQLGEFDFEGSW